MEISLIILSIAGIVVLLMMIFIYKENTKTRKAYEQDLKSYSNLDQEYEVNNTE